MRPMRGNTIQKIFWAHKIWILLLTAINLLQCIPQPIKSWFQAVLYGQLYFFIPSSLLGKWKYITFAFICIHWLSHEAIIHLFSICKRVLHSYAIIISFQSITSKYVSCACICTPIFFITHGYQNVSAHSRINLMSHKADINLWISVWKVCQDFFPSLIGMHLEKSITCIYFVRVLIFLYLDIRRIV